MNVGKRRKEVCEEKGKKERREGGKRGRREGGEREGGDYGRPTLARVVQTVKSW